MIVRDITNLHACQPPMPVRYRAMAAHHFLSSFSVSWSLSSLGFDVDELQSRLLGFANRIPKNGSFSLTTNSDRDIYIVH